MELEEVGKAISNPLRTLILSLLVQNSHITLDECFRLVKKEYPKIHQETVYRSLEKLHHAGLISKEYSHKSKRLEYNILSKIIQIDFLNKSIKFQE